MLNACVFRAELPDGEIRISCTDICPAGRVCLKQADDISGFCVPTDLPCIRVEGIFARSEADGNECGSGMICVQARCVESKCGDGVISGDETCDRTEGCREDCTQCGDGRIDDSWGEACDNGSQNSDIDSGACRSSCELARCGDGIIDPGEGCDDGLQNSDSLAGACRLTCARAGCGDGILDEGEECDHGDQNSDLLAGACRSTCVHATCGDGVLDEGEECDDGPRNSDVEPGACRTTCRDSFCGDSIIDPNEECDDGPSNSNLNPDTCRTDCHSPRCGDGIIDRGEDCDEGSSNSDTSPGSCRQNCALPRCGDGVVDDNEGCDSLDPASGCRPDCTRCGDGVVDDGEACDDGNTASGDGCRADCLKIEVCGDSVLDHGEPCDDGNNNPADGCHACISQQWRTELVISGQNRGINPLDFQLDVPLGLSLDQEERLYFSDVNAHRIYRIDTDGTLTAMAGSGRADFGGDNGPAPAADFDMPSGLAIDFFGALLIADRNNHRVRRVTRNEVTTVLGESGGVVGGGGAGGFVGGGLEDELTPNIENPFAVLLDSMGQVYIGMEGGIVRQNEIGELVAVTGKFIDGLPSPGFSLDGVPALNAPVGTVTSMVLDADGHLIFAEQSYFRDASCARIRRIDEDGSLITLAGNGISFSPVVTAYSPDGTIATEADLHEVFGLAMDAAGRILFADRDANLIRVIQPDGTLATLAGKEPAASFVDALPANEVPIQSPSSLATGPDGTIYYGEKNFIRRIDSDGKVYTVAGRVEDTAPLKGWSDARSTGLSSPADVIWRTDPETGAKDVLVADGARHQILLRNSRGQLSVFGGTGTRGDSGDGGLALNMEMTTPIDMAIDSTGNLYILDRSADRVRKVDTNGVATTFAGTGERGYAGDGGPATSAHFRRPKAIEWMSDGSLLVADHGNRALRKIFPDGHIETIAGGGTLTTFSSGESARAVSMYPAALQASSDGSVYILDDANESIYRLHTDGTLHHVTFSHAAELSPSHIAVDLSDRLHFWDSESGALYRRENNGTLSELFRSDMDSNSCSSAHPRNDGEDLSQMNFCHVRAIATDDGIRFLIAEVPDSGSSMSARVRLVDTTQWGKTIVGPLHPPGPGEGTFSVLYPSRALFDLHESGYDLSAGPYPLHGIFSTSSLGRLQALSLAADVVSLDVVMGDPEQSTSEMQRSIDFAPLLEVGEGLAFDPVARAIVITESRQSDFLFDDCPMEVTNGLNVVETDCSAGLRMVYVDANADGIVDAPEEWTQKRVSTSLKEPWGIAYDEDSDTFLVVERGNHCISRVNRHGELCGPDGLPLPGERDGSESVVGVCGVSGSVSGYLQNPTHLKVSPITQAIYVSDTGNHRIVRHHKNRSETILGDGFLASAGRGVPARDFSVAAPGQLDMDQHGNLYVAATTAVRMIVNVDGDEDADGDDEVRNIFAGQERSRYPARDSYCIQSLTLHQDGGLYVADGCLGFLVRLHTAAASSP